MGWAKGKAWGYFIEGMDVAEGSLLLWAWVRCSTSAVCRELLTLMTNFVSTNVTGLKKSQLGKTGRHRFVAGISTIENGTRQEKQRVQPMLQNPMRKISSHYIY